MSIVKEGDFKSLKLGDGELEMLEDAYQAVTKANRWSYLKRDDVPGTRPCAHCNGKNCEGRFMPEVNSKCFCVGNCRICEGKGEIKQGFMFNDAKEIRDIDVFMEYDGHSGSSYGWTMRNMEYIAKNGWDAYVKFKGVKPQPPSPINNLAAVMSFMASNPPTQDLNAFANAVQNNPGMRAVIPDIDKQVDGIRKYAQAVKNAEKDPATWKKSNGFPYPCPCHVSQGKEGWCGVAGFGVPACEH